MILRWLIGATLAVLLVSRASPQGGFNGDPTGDRTKTDQDTHCKWTSTLNPVPATLTGDLTSTKDGLDHAGFKAANGWTIVEKNLAGSLKLHTYYAWVTNQPIVVCGDVTSEGGDTGRIGGAAFALEYTPGAGDPVGADVDWVQGVRTNDPDQGGKDVGGGWYHLVDNGGSTTDPTYNGNGGAADSKCFVDVPYAECLAECNNSVSFRFSVFVSAVDVPNKKITLYKQGVAWGYDFVCSPVPEPATWTVMGVALFKRRRR